MELDLRPGSLQLRPLADRFLDPVLAEDTLAGCKCRRHPLRRLHLADRHQRYRRGFAAGVFGRASDAPAHGCQLRAGGL